MRCQYCETDKDGYITENWGTREYAHIKQRIKLVIFGSYLHARVGKISTKYEINFCPYCGRKLKED